MKYIMLRTVHDDIVRDVPIIFPNALVHGDVAAVIRHIVSMQHATPIAAGEINLVVESTHGSSETLSLEARDEDARTITLYDYYHGYVPFDRAIHCANHRQFEYDCIDCDDVRTGS